MNYRLQISKNNKILIWFAVLFFLISIIIETTRLLLIKPKIQIIIIMSVIRIILWLFIVINFSALLINKKITLGKFGLIIHFGLFSEFVHYSSIKSVKWTEADKNYCHRKYDYGSNQNRITVYYLDKITYITVENAGSFLEKINDKIIVSHKQ